MPEIRDMTSDDTDLAIVRELFWEYLQWANTRVDEEFAVDFDIATMLKHDLSTLEKFAPPSGRLLLAANGGEVVGLGCLKQLHPGVGEIKRMYLRPDARGTGLGRALLESLLVNAKQAGYTHIRLDSAGFMKAAHSLYRSAGFREIDPYPESEIPPAFQKHWVFMERDV